MAKLSKKTINREILKKIKNKKRKKIKRNKMNKIIY